MKVARLICVSIANQISSVKTFLSERLPDTSSLLLEDDAVASLRKGKLSELLVHYIIVQEHEVSQS